MPRNRRSHRASSEELLDTLVERTSKVLEGIELHQARVELATALQRQMLPAQLPSVPGLRTAARYTPARQGLDIGGDWYDAFAMPDGMLGIAIGDVQGHDVEAAAFVGQVRTGLRAIAGATTDPGTVLTQVNELLVSMNSGLFVTCSFLCFDPLTGELADSRAGHVPAVWASADGHSEIVTDAGGLPLGIFPSEKYPVTRRLLEPEGAFVLLTDGVVEGPSFPIEEGLDRVVGVVRNQLHADPDLLAAEVMKVADFTGHNDDAAVLVLRHDGTANMP